MGFYPFLAFISLVTKQVSAICLIPGIFEIFSSIKGSNPSREGNSTRKNIPQSPDNLQISVIASILSNSRVIVLICLRSGWIFIVAFVGLSSRFESMTMENFLIILYLINLFTRRLTVASVFKN